MPAITVEDTLVLPRITRPALDTSRPRPVSKIVDAAPATEGAGFVIRRPFPGRLSLTEADPFLLLDHIGPVVVPSGAAKGAPWHPHRGFETVTYVMDGEVAHSDTNGGGGVIRAGDTQWMTAGSGLLHDELPSEDFWRSGGPMHALQLWVNLPPALKMTPPRYQAIAGDQVTLLTTPDGGALVRLVAGELDGHRGSGSTHTPITYAHVTLASDAQLVLPWRLDFNAFTYAITGRGSIGPDHRPLAEGQLGVFGHGDHLVVTADEHEPLDVLIFGGVPIGAPIEHYGPFVMNTRDEINQAIDDYQAGRLGIIPADETGPRSFR